MIRRATEQDVEQLAGLAVQLWPGHTAQELSCEFAGMMRLEQAAFFLAVEDARPVGFSQCQLRRDYVEGTASSPVGYLEGIFVTEDYRGRGLAKRLLLECERWAALQGCREFASDCELDNNDSLRFHLRMGFCEANRVICFTKQLQEG